MEIDLYRESIAIGVISKPAINIAVNIPGASLLITFFVASGVKSLLENPVPPVVRITLTLSLSLREIRYFYVNKYIK